MEFFSCETNHKFCSSCLKHINKTKNELEKIWLDVKKANISVLVVLEGQVFCEKSDVMSEMASLIDPRFFRTHLIKKPTEFEKQMPLMWRFWVKTPKKGEIVFLDGSWYYDLFFKKLKKLKFNANLFDRHLELAKNFEHYLIADGTIIVKIYFKFSNHKKKRLIYHNFSNKFSFNKNRMNSNNSFVFDEGFVLNRTNFSGSSWNIVSYESRCYKILTSLKILLNSLKYALRGFELEKQLVQRKFLKLSCEFVKPITNKLNILKSTKKLEKGFYRFNLKHLQFKLSYLQKVLFFRKIPLIVLFEGIDAAGKGGSIKRIISALDARFYRVIPIFKPNECELNHHYLWRFIKKLPEKGHVAIFDRSWYGRILVEKVDKLTSIADCNRAYGEINCFEKELVQSGFILIKFWLQISKSEQLKRFKKRESSPEKSWKLTADDWKNRKKWNDYKIAVDEMFKKTSTKIAPWHLINSNSKKVARLQVLNELILEIKKKLQID